MSTEPIVNPKIFYWIDVVKSLEYASWIAASVAGLALLWFIIYFMINLTDGGYYGSHSYEKERKFAIKGIKILVPVVLVCFLLASFIPSEKTIYRMLIADQLTPANIQYVGDTVEDCIDYMFDKVDELINDDVEE